jgi:hypothetical protein
MWSLTLREGRRLEVFETRPLRNNVGPREKKATGSWRNVCSKDFHYLKRTATVIKGARGRRGRLQTRGRSACRILMGKPGRNGPENPDSYDRKLLKRVRGI